MSRFVRGAAGPSRPIFPRRDRLEAIPVPRQRCGEWRSIPEHDVGWPGQVRIPEEERSVNRVVQAYSVDAISIPIAAERSPVLSCRTKADRVVSTAWTMVIAKEKET